MKASPVLVLSVSRIPLLTREELADRTLTLTREFSLHDNGKHIADLAPKSDTEAALRVATARAWALASLPPILRQLMLDPASVTLSRDGEGRPYLVGRPVDFNLSHSAAHAAVAAVPSPYRVGVDVEEPIPAARADSLVRRYATEGERAMMADPTVDFTLIWTVREAIAKYTGEGNPTARDAATPPCGVRIRSGILPDTGARLTVCCPAEITAICPTPDSLPVAWDFEFVATQR